MPWSENSLELTGCFLCYLSKDIVCFGEFSYISVEMSVKTEKYSSYLCLNLFLIISAYKWQLNFYILLFCLLSVNNCLMCVDRSILPAHLCSFILCRNVFRDVDYAYCESVMMMIVLLLFFPSCLLVKCFFSVMFLLVCVCIFLLFCVCVCGWWWGRGVLGGGGGSIPKGTLLVRSV